MDGLHRCTQDHPYRPPDWRWRRACYLAENKIKRLSRKHDDDDVMEARKLKSALDACETDLAVCQLMERAGDIFIAHDMWHQEDEWGEGSRGRGNPARYELEAALLAGSPPERIATSLGTSPSAVRIYERLFFNVIDRLHNPGYVIHQVMGPSIHKGLSDRDYDLLWKLVGYLHGPIALECFITTAASPTRVERPDQMQALYVDGTKEAMRRKSYIAARTLPINSYTQVQILELYNRQVEIEKSGDAFQSEQQIMQNIEAAIMAMPWAVGRTVSERMDPGLKSHYDTSVAIDLRADEILALGMGVKAGVADDYKDFKFPEVKGAKDDPSTRQGS